MSPRDVSRLKSHMLTFIQSVYTAGNLEGEAAYQYILSRIYARQIVGPSKLLLISMFATMCFFSIITLDIYDTFIRHLRLSCISYVTYVLN